MANMNSYADGQFCWVDLMSRDMASAQEFYVALFGWTALTQDTAGGPPYACFAHDGQLVAGLGEMNEQMKASGMPPVWNSYISVGDIDATTERAAERGAQVIMSPFQIMQAGKMAVVQDPAGAAISFWQKLDHFGAQYVNHPNGWVWNELITKYPEKAIDFYSDLFAWSIEKEQGADGDYWMAKNRDRMNGGIMRATPEMGDMPSHWSVYFAVDDISASKSRLEQLGGSVLRDTFEVSVGHICVVADTQGAVFNLIQLTVPADE